MRDLIDYLAKSIVDLPDDVHTDERPRGGRTVITLRVAEEDKGKVIGREGRVANAMRALLRVAASESDTEVALEVR